MAAPDVDGQGIVVRAGWVCVAVRSAASEANEARRVVAQVVLRGQAEMREDWREAAAGVVIVGIMVGFAVWLLLEILPAMAQAGWMMVR